MHSICFGLICHSTSDESHHQIKFCPIVSLLDRFPVHLNNKIFYVRYASNIIMKKR